MKGRFPFLLESMLGAFPFFSGSNDRISPTACFPRESMIRLSRASDKCPVNASRQQQHRIGKDCFFQVTEASIIIAPMIGILYEVRVEVPG